jgi:hypothetical protein
MSPLETLQTLLNAAHTQGQDDYRDNISDNLVRKHASAFDIARQNHENAIEQLERDNAELRKRLEEAREVVKPFAEEAGAWNTDPEKFPDRSRIVCQGLDRDLDSEPLCALFNLGDLRRAREWAGREGE